MHQTFPLSSVRMNWLRSRVAASQRRADNVASRLNESRRDMQLEWPPTNEAKGAPIERLHIVVAKLRRALNNALRDEREGAQECIKRVAELLQIHGAPPGATDEFGFPRAGDTQQARGGLAQGRIRRLTAHSEANLDAPLSTRDLSALVRLSSSHLVRAFGNSLGYTPHGYVIRRRVERAQDLTLSADTQPVQTAADFGIADQSHFRQAIPQIRRRTSRCMAPRPRDPAH
jgi:AraC family transcriptional regulator